MTLLVDLALRHALWPVLTWTAALGVGCIIAIVITWRVLASFERTRIMFPSARPFWYAWLALALVIVPALGTLLFAAPFALERELAIAISRHPPLVVDWAARYGSRSLRTTIGVSDDDVLMDVGWVQRRLSSADQTSAGTLSMAWRAIPRFVEAPYLRAAHRVLTAAGTGSSGVTWRQLDEQARALLTASASVAANGLSLTFHAAALRYLLFWWLTLAGCHLSTLGLYVLCSTMRPGSTM